MKKIVGFFVLLIVMLYSFCFAGVEIPENIRVGLYSGTRAVSSFKISSESGMQIGLVDEDGEFELIEEIKKNKEIEVKKGSNSYSIYIEGVGELGDDENFVRIIPNENANIPLLKIKDEKNANNYRGELEIRRFSTSDMTVINILSMQEYLYGVVPREIGGNSPLEAVKAQAIVARTYATKNYNKRKIWDFNLTNTVDDQAYGGYDWEKENSNNAVDETYGMVVTYDGELIGGYYFSTSGGYTESSANVWGGEVDYLEAVPDPYEPQNLSKTTWSVTYTADDIKKILVEKNINIGDILNIVINDFSEAGRVLKLEIIGTKGTYVASKSQARTLLNLNSQWYTVNDDEPEIPEYVISEYENDKNKEDDDTKNNRRDDEKENAEETEDEQVRKPILAMLVNMISERNFLAFNDEVKIDAKYTAKKVKNKVSTFEIKGRGIGHAVGMSQNGAIGMANNNFTCEEIIKWYYRGVEIES